MSSEVSEWQIELLKNEDHRFHAIGPGGTGLIMLATTEKKSKKGREVISFGLPSASALFLNLAIDARRRRLGIDLNNTFVPHPPPQGTWPEDHTPLFNYFESITAEVIFSFSAIEAFVNESIPSDFVYRHKTRSGVEIDLSADDIERIISIDEKLNKVIPISHNLVSPSGGIVWQKFKALKGIRDRLVHLKSIDRKASGPEDQTIWGILVESVKSNFAQDAYKMIGSFPTLVQDRRWYQLIGTHL